MEVLVGTWLMISTVNARMGGKERPATPVSVCVFVTGAKTLLCCVLIPITIFWFLQRTASAMRTPATMGAPAMTRGIHLSACVLLLGKAPLVTLVSVCS